VYALRWWAGGRAEERIGVLDYDRLIKRSFAPVEQTCTTRESILYALTVGYGADPCDELELPFVYEATPKVAQTLPLVLGSPRFWLDAPSLPSV
jgi:hypothetical protein